MRGKSAVRRWLSEGGLVVAKHASPPILMAGSEPVLWCPRVHRVQVTAGWRELQTSEDTPSYTCPWSCCTLQELGNRLGGRDGWEKTYQQVGWQLLLSVDIWSKDDNTSERHSNYFSKYLFQPWDGSGRGPWGSGDAPSWSQTAPGSSGGGQGEGRPTLIIWFSNINFRFNLKLVQNAIFVRYDWFPGRKRKGCFDLWRWFWAWALLCRIHRWDGNVPMQKKQDLGRFKI